MSPPTFYIPRRMASRPRGRDGHPADSAGRPKASIAAKPEPHWLLRGRPDTGGSGRQALPVRGAAGSLSCPFGDGDPAVPVTAARHAKSSERTASTDGGPPARSGNLWAG